MVTCRVEQVIIQHSSFIIGTIYHSSFNTQHCLVLFPQFVVLVHRVVDALQDKALDDINGHVYGRLQHLHVIVGVVAEHPVDLSAARIVVADTHAQACEILADQLQDMAQTVVSAIAAVGFQSEISQGQGYVIADDE